MGGGLENVLGATLVGKKGPVATSSIKSKVVMFYFSAHWCPPCRGFTPKLEAWYNAVKKKGVDLEIVFISSDRSQEAFEDYYLTMPWLAMPFEDRDLKAKLSSQLKISGIPTLLVADGETGEVYNRDGRSIVQEDAGMIGEGYPWMPPALETLLGGPFIRNDGTKVEGSSLKGRKIAIYASASWCGPCQAFTPQLKDVYTKTLEAGKDWEIIYLSGDRDEASMMDYFKKQPWLAIPFEDTETRSALMSHFGIEGFPTLIMLDEDLNVTNKGLRGYISDDPEGKEFPWTPKPVLTLDQAGGDLNELPVLTILMEKESEATQAQFSSILTKLAESHKAKVKAKKADDILFCIAPGDTDLSSRIRQLAKVPATKRALCNGDLCVKLDDSSAVVLIDIPDNGGYYVLDGELSPSSITEFYDSYISGSLKKDRKQLGE